MKIVNPIGRNVSLNADEGINPRACMCAIGLSFSSALGNTDHCGHCGCNCYPFMEGANASTAYGTYRASV